MQKGKKAVWPRETNGILPPTHRHSECSVMCTDAKQKIKDAYNRLINLNVTGLLGGLYAKDVITGREKQIIHSITIESDKMAHLLDHVIIPSLEAGTTEKLKSFLEIMEESDDPVINSVGRRVGMLIVIWHNIMIAKFKVFFLNKKKCHQNKQILTSINICFSLNN